MQNVVEGLLCLHMLLAGLADYPKIAVKPVVKSDIAFEEQGDASSVMLYSIHTRGKQDKTKKTAVSMLAGVRYRENGQEHAVLVNLNLLFPQGRIIGGKTPSGLFKIDPGVLSYISCWPTDKTLPRGLFFWLDDWDIVWPTDSTSSIVPKVGNKPPFSIPVRTSYKSDPVYYEKTKKDYPFTSLPESESRHPAGPIRRWAEEVLFDLNMAFEYVLGLSETTFQQEVAGTIWPARDFFDISKVNATLQDSHGLRLVKAAVKTFQRPTVAELEKNAEAQLAKCTKAPSVARLFILKTSTAGDQSTRIEYLQERFGVVKSMPVRAAFQIASTPSCLEGFMDDPHKGLNEMQLRPAQGEDASLRTMPAVIARRYGVPRGERLLFKGEDEVKDETAFIAGCGIGVHHCVPVIAGYLNGVRIPRPDSPFDSDNTQANRSVAAFAKQLNPEVYVDHIFTSAVHLKKVENNKKKQKKAKLVLKAMYKGTILAAFTLFADQLEKKSASDYVPVKTEPAKLVEALHTSKVPTLFLTLLGAGAFNNELSWVVEALEESADLIKKCGLQVCLIVRDTPPALSLKQEIQARLSKLDIKINGM